MDRWRLWRPFPKSCWDKKNEDEIIISYCGDKCSGKVSILSISPFRAFGANIHKKYLTSFLIEISYLLIILHIKLAYVIN